MKKTVSLKENHLFRRLYRKGKTVADGRIALYARHNGRKENRLGLTVSTKVGCAVVRNRVRRRLREIYRLNAHRFKTGYDIVIVARMRCVGAEYKKLEAAVLEACEKLELLEERP